jgi:hypothetical protein
MPFFYDETNIEYPEDGSDPPPPRLDQFAYMTATEYGGPHAPARFSISPITEQPASGPPPQQARRGILNGLLGWTRSSNHGQERQQSLEERIHQRRLEEGRRRQQLFSVLIPPLRDFGVWRAYCRYDGGNDEGWSWLDHFERRGGERIDLDALTRNLHDKGIFDKLCAAGFMNHLRGGSTAQPTAELRRFLSNWLIDEWASILFGGGFGAGEYSMYGAFTVDLDACTITDDPHADPVVENIRIAT